MRFVILLIALVLCGCTSVKRVNGLNIKIDNTLNVVVANDEELFNAVAIPLAKKYGGISKDRLRLVDGIPINIVLLKVDLGFNEDGFNGDAYERSIYYVMESDDSRCYMKSTVVKSRDGFIDHIFNFLLGTDSSDKGLHPPSVIDLLGAISDEISKKYEVVE
jgi:hypothetical protein